MKLHEYQSKQIFSRYAIPIPKGRVAATATEARQIAEELGGRHAPDPGALAAIFADADAGPKAVMHRLVW